MTWVETIFPERFTRWEPLKWERQSQESSPKRGEFSGSLGNRRGFLILSRNSIGGKLFFLLSSKYFVFFQYFPVSPPLFMKNLPIFSRQGRKWDGVRIPPLPKELFSRGKFLTNPRFLFSSGGLSRRRVEDPLR